MFFTGEMANLFIDLISKKGLRVNDFNLLYVKNFCIEIHNIS